MCTYIVECIANVPVSSHLRYYPYCSMITMGIISTTPISTTPLSLYDNDIASSLSLSCCYDNSIITLGTYLCNNDCLCKYSNMSFQFIIKAIFSLSLEKQCPFQLTNYPIKGHHHYLSYDNTKYAIALNLSFVLYRDI